MEFNLSPEERIERRQWILAVVKAGSIAYETAARWGFLALCGIAEKKPKRFDDGGRLSEEELLSIIGMLEEGYNEAYAVSLLSISAARYRNEKKLNLDFALQVEQSLQVTDGFCSALLARKAVLEDSADAATRYLSYSAKRMQFVHTRSITRAELGIKRKLADLAVQERSALTSDDYRPDFSMLSNTEFKRYTDLHDLAVEGRPLTSFEHEEFGRLVYAITRRAAVATGAKTIDVEFKQLNPPNPASPDLRSPDAEDNGDSNGNGNGFKGNGSNGFH